VHIQPKEVTIVALSMFLIPSLVCPSVLSCVCCIQTCMMYVYKHTRWYHCTMMNQEQQRMNGEQVRFGFAVTIRPLTIWHECHRDFIGACMDRGGRRPHRFARGVSEASFRTSITRFSITVFCARLLSSLWTLHRIDRRQDIWRQRWTTRIWQHL